MTCASSHTFNNNNNNNDNDNDNDNNDNSSLFRHLNNSRNNVLKCNQIMLKK